MPSPDWNEEFEKVISSAGHPVGSEELAAREALGDEQYEKLMAMTDRSNFLALLKDEAQIKYLAMLGGLHTALSIFILCSTLLGLAWSFYFWFK